MPGILENREPRTGSYYYRDWNKEPPIGYVEHLAYAFKKIVVDPTVKYRMWLKTLRGEPYYWYHRQYRRVPTIDMCYEDDAVCKYEATEQFKRDRLVDDKIVYLLQKRAEDCIKYEGYEKHKCKPFFDAVKEARTNYVIKYGDLGGNAIICYKALLKQKHRMAFERRHGEVGKGMKKKHVREDGSFYYE